MLCIARAVRLIFSKCRAEKEDENKYEHGMQNAKMSRNPVVTYSGVKSGLKIRACDAIIISIGDQRGQS